MNGTGKKRDANHSALWLERGSKYARRIEWTAGLLVEIDDLLEAWRLVLERSQPPQNGKLGLRWWKMTGTDKMREPVLVEWKRGRDKRFFPVVVKPTLFCRKVKRMGGFALNEPVTREAAHYVVAVLKIRVALKAVLYGGRSMESGLNHHADIIGFQVKRAVELSEAIRRKPKPKEATMPAFDEDE